MKKQNDHATRKLERLQLYLKILYKLQNQGRVLISSSQLAKEIDYSEEQIRKDFQLIATKQGKPGVGRRIDDIVADLEEYLGYKKVSNAVVIGVGNLGGAILRYEGFANYGLNVLAGFDIDNSKIGTVINDKPIFSIDNLEKYIPTLDVNIAILTVGKENALEIAQRLVKAGIQGILNFVPIHLEIDEGVIVQNMDLAASLSILAHKVKNKLNND
ncbi:MAG: redox-sensing transcriptional repressor Rex [Bacilli bacterium]|nr:redox-sensing transcriptional repressor Rex [Bacilli bacterium]MBR1581996.1 redox-sensing transcriptional repressor Rex [Bacilli bacterium]